MGTVHEAVLNCFANMKNNPRNNQQALQQVLDCLIAETRATPTHVVEQSFLNHMHSAGGNPQAATSNDVHNFCVTVANNKLRGGVQQNIQQQQPTSFIGNNQPQVGGFQQQQYFPNNHQSPFGGTANFNNASSDFFSSNSNVPVQSTQSWGANSGGRTSAAWPTKRVEPDPIDNRVNCNVDVSASTAGQAANQPVYEKPTPKRRRDVEMTFTISDYKEELDGKLFEYHGGRKLEGSDVTRGERDVAYGVEYLMTTVCSDQESVAKLALRSDFFKGTHEKKIMGVNAVSIDSIYPVPFGTVAAHLVDETNEDYIRRLHKLPTTSPAGKFITSRYRATMTRLLNASVFVPGFIRIDDLQEVVDFCDPNSAEFNMFRDRYEDYDKYQKRFSEAERIAAFNTIADINYLDPSSADDLSDMIRNSGSICFSESNSEVNSSLIPYLINEVNEPSKDDENYSNLIEVFKAQQNLKSYLESYTFSLNRSNILVLNKPLPGLEGAEPGRWRFNPGDMAMGSVWFIHPSDDAYTRMFLMSADWALSHSVRTQVYCPIDVGNDVVEYKLFDLAHAYGIGYYLY